MLLAARKQLAIHALVEVALDAIADTSSKRAALPPQLPAPLTSLLEGSHLTCGAQLLHHAEDSIATANTDESRTPSISHFLCMNVTKFIRGTFTCLERSYFPMQIRILLGICCGGIHRICHLTVCGSNSSECRKK